MGQLRHDAELLARAQLGPTTRLGKSGALPTADRGGDGTVSARGPSPVSSNNIGVRRGRTMEKNLSGVVIASIVAIALPAWSQFSTTQGQSPQQNVPGTRRPSKSGVGVAWKQIRPDGDALWHDSARGLHRGSQMEIRARLQGFPAANQARPSSLRTPPNKPDQGPGCRKAAANFASGAINDPVSERMSKLTSKSGELMSAADRGAGASA
jgi:hypothetical protein